MWLNPGNWRYVRDRRHRLALIGRDIFDFREHATGNSDSPPCILADKNTLKAILLGGNDNCVWLAWSSSLGWGTSDSLSHRFSDSLRHFKCVEAHQRKNLDHFAQESLCISFFRLRELRLLWFRSVFQM